MQLGIRAKITAGFGIGLLLLVFVAWLGTNSIQRTTAVYVQTVSDLQKQVIDVLQVRGNFNQATVDLMRYVASRSPKELATFVHDNGVVAQELRVRQAQSSAESQATWGQAVSLFDAWNTQASTLIQYVRSGQIAKADRFLDASVVNTQHRLVSFLSRRVVLAGTRFAREERDASSSAAHALWVLMVGAFVALTGGTVAAWLLVRSITSNLSSAISTLTSATAEMLAATTQQASGTAEEAAAVQQTSTTVEELRQTVEVSARKAGEVAEASQKTDEVSATGRDAVEQTLQVMRDVRSQMESLSERVFALSEQSQTIGGITTTVNDLAEQSNLLAVNAAIEAAKAGDAGKGFAVVAAEVRRLAEQSKQATAQVRGILADIQKATQSTVMAMEQGVRTVESAERTAANAGNSIKLLSSHIGASSQMARQIVASANQQVVGVEQISAAMKNIQQSSIQNMASTRQLDRTGRNLGELAGALSQLLHGGGAAGRQDLSEGGARAARSLQVEARGHEPGRPD